MSCAGPNRTSAWAGAASCPGSCPATTASSSRTTVRSRRRSPPVLQPVDSRRSIRLEPRAVARPQDRSGAAVRIPAGHALDQERGHLAGPVGHLPLPVRPGRIPDPSMAPASSVANHSWSQRMTIRSAPSSIAARASARRARPRPRSSRPTRASTCRDRSIRRSTRSATGCGPTGAGCGSAGSCDGRGSPWPAWSSPKPSCGPSRGSSPWSGSRSRPLPCR